MIRSNCEQDITSASNIRQINVKCLGRKSDLMLVSSVDKILENLWSIIEELFSKISIACRQLLHKVPGQIEDGPVWIQKIDLKEMLEVVVHGLELDLLHESQGSDLLVFRWEASFVGRFKVMPCVTPVIVGVSVVVDIPLHCRAA